MSVSQEESPSFQGGEDVKLLILHVGDGTVRFAVKAPVDTPIGGAPGEVINDHLRPDVSKDPS
jgi:hypothetical protein